VREFLSVNNVPFEDRNIRKHQDARAELEARTGALVVPQLFWGDRRIIGYDPEALDELVSAYERP
jgi:glutaredoxin